MTPSSARVPCSVFSAKRWKDPLAGEVLFGRLVKGGTVIVDEPEDGGDKLVLRFEEK